MLAIDFDVPDAAISDPGLTLLDPASSFSSVIDPQGAQSGYFIPPGSKALMIRPQQLMPGWDSELKFRHGDYGSPSGWEEQQVRADGDWFMHSIGAATPLALAYTFPANTGWFVEFHAYALPKSVSAPIFDLTFGGHFTVILWSDGKLDLYDSRFGSLTPIASGVLAGSNSFENQPMSIAVLPYRRNHLLVWSPSRGGSIDAAVTVADDGAITESCCPVIYSTVTPPSALAAISPLLYISDYLPQVNAPRKSLVRPLSQTPSFAGSLYDMPGKTAVVFDAVTSYVAGEDTSTFIYSVAMAGNTSGQSAEAQGVVGISSSTSTATGDSMFTRSGGALSLQTPFLYFVQMGYQRTLASRETSPMTLTGVLDAHLSLSRDRSSKSFTFVVDNPANITGIGVNYRSLKDMQNRRCRAYLTNPALEAGGGPDEIAADPDPDTALIVSYGNERVYLFDGFTDQPEFIDGANSRLRFRCQGLWKRLRSYIYLDQPCYDGMLVADVVEDLLKRAGFVGTDDVAATELPPEIYLQTSSAALPSAAPGDEPLFVPAIGTSAEDVLQAVMHWTGWVLDDLISAGSASSAWYWSSQDYYAESVYAAQGSPSIGVASSFNTGLQAGTVPFVDASRPNPGLGSLAMLANRAPLQSLEEPIANEIYVFGCDDLGQPVVAQARDESSIGDRTADNYVGEPRPYVYFSKSINTQEFANLVCAQLYTALRATRVQVVVELPDYYPQLGISAPVSLVGYWSGAVVGVEAQLGQLNIRKTTLTVLKNT